MKKIEAILRPEKVNDVKAALDDLGFHGMNFIQVTGRGAQRGIVHQGRSGETVTVDRNAAPKCNWPAPTFWMPAC